jgi:ethanolamine ammonia-lyase small subunit
MSTLPNPLGATPEPDPWVSLKAFTAARIALGRTGTSVPVQESLAFKLAHAHARDAVYSALATDELLAGLQALQGEVYQVASQAKNRQEYLQRPDWGRHLADSSRAFLTEQAPAEAYDIALVLADGLSATAINSHALLLLHLLLPQLQQAGFRLAPVTLAEQARVALGDEVGELLRAQLVLVLIGERPGLSAPYSLGAYFTYAPRLGLTDEARNCISNIRPEGLPYPQAATKLSFLLQESLKLKLSGVGLKDQSDLLSA